MSELKFEDPPQRVSGRHWGRHRLLASEMKARPMEWALVGTYGSSDSAASMARNIKLGKLKAYEPAGAFESTSRTVDKQPRVYARYLGEAEAAS
jgi:hypothetical protein